MEKKETIKKNVFLTLYLLFIVLTLASVVLYLLKVVSHIGFFILPMLFVFLFGTLYRNSRNAVKELSAVK